MVPRAAHAVCVGVFVFFCVSCVLQFRGVEQVHTVCARVPTVSGTLCARPFCILHPGDLPLPPSPCPCLLSDRGVLRGGDRPGVSLVRGPLGALFRLRGDPCPGPHGRTFPDDLPGLRERMQAGLPGTSDELATLLTWSGRALRLGGPWGWGRGSQWLLGSVLSWALGRDGAHLCVPWWCSQSPGEPGAGGFQ